MLFKGNSSKLELLIEKIQANKETTGDTMGTDPSLSWNSETADEDHNSLSPSSCETPDGNEAEINFTIGPTESTPYSCQFCEKAFPRLSYLKKHEQSHSDQMPFKCDFCQRLFKHKRSRDRHVKLHTGDKKYRCPHCESAFSRSDHLKIHLKTHDHQKPYQCVVCNRGYNTAAALTSHMQNHKKESTTSSPSPGQFRCLQCNGTFSTGEDLQTHVSHSHGTPPPPPEKSKTSTPTNKTPSSSPASRVGSVDLDNPMSRLMLPFSVPKLACIYCAKDSFTSMESLQLHVQALHGPLLNGEVGDSPHHMSPIGTPLAGVLPDLSLSSTNLPCNFCTMKFPNLSSLHKHVVTVHSLSYYLQAKAKENAFCAPCAIAFPSSAAYAEHFMTFHVNSGYSPSKPMQVGPSSSSEPPQVKPTDLSKKSKSSSESSFMSSSSAPATKKFKREDGSSSRTSHTSTPEPSSTSSALQSSLTAAAASNFGMNSLLCNQCNAGFTDFESFRAHLKSHLEEVVQKYVCDQCESDFPTEEQLESHSMAHYLSTSTEYGCQSCLKLFGKPDELQKHLLDIHAHHLYRCSLCKDIFDSKVSIQVHFAVKHSNECKLFQCTSCSNVFRSEVDFQMHVRLIHLRKPSPFRCLLCSSSFSSEIELQFHLSTHQKQFQCKLCDEAFHVEFLLDKHMQSHHMNMVNGNDSNSQSRGKGNRKNASSSAKSKELRCDICDKSFPSESETIVHRKQVHHVSSHSDLLQIQPPPQEQQQDLDLKASSSKLSTSKSHHHSPSTSSSSGRSLSLSCAYCNENCKSRSDLENHMKTHQVVSSGKNKCNICDEVCPTPTLLAEHKLTHCKVISGNKCTGCKTNVTSEDQYMMHMKQHNNQPNGTSLNVPIPCIICRQTLMTEMEIQLHSRFHTNSSSSQDLESISSISGASNPVQQNNNSLMSSAFTSFQCCLCLRVEEKPRNGTSTSPDEVKPFICVTCCQKTAPFVHPSSVGFPQGMSKSPEKLKDETLQSSKTYQCIKCQMSFSSEDEIQSHVTTHLRNEGSSHECYLCPHPSFDSPSKLQVHLIEHTFDGCSSFTCYMCSSVFTAASGLQQHMLEHGLHNRPYDCSFCHLKFFFRAELENHLVSHEKMKQTFLGASSPQSSRPLLPLLVKDFKPIGAGSSINLSTRSKNKSSSNGSKPKKFFYRSDDSDEEEVDMSVNFKKEPKSDEDSQVDRASGGECSLHLERNSKTPLGQSEAGGRHIEATN